MINTLIELYINRKIVNFTTVETAVTRLASHTKSKPTQEKAVREHDKLVSKYADALPATGRIARQVLEKRKKVLSKVLSTFSSLDSFRVVCVDLIDKVN